MKCPQCVQEGTRSVVTQHESTAKAPYVPMQWDEEGNLIGRLNLTSTRYSCSNGHTWWVSDD